FDSPKPQVRGSLARVGWTRCSSHGPGSWAASLPLFRGWRDATGYAACLRAANPSPITSERERWCPCVRYPQTLAVGGGGAAGRYCFRGFKRYFCGGRGESIGGACGARWRPPACEFIAECASGVDFVSLNFAGVRSLWDQTLTGTHEGNFHHQSPSS